MNKSMISETLSKTINENSKLVREQAERISKLTTSALPKFDTTRITGIASLGNTNTHSIECFFVVGHSLTDYCCSSQTPASHVLM